MASKAKQGPSQSGPGLGAGVSPGVKYQRSPSIPAAKIIPNSSSRGRGLK